MMGPKGEYGPGVRVIQLDSGVEVGIGEWNGETVVSIRDTTSLHSPTIHLTIGQLRGILKVASKR